MDMLTIEQQILVLENTIKVIEGKHGRDPDDVELRGTCIVIITHLRDHLNGIKRRVFQDVVIVYMVMEKTDLNQVVHRIKKKISSILLYYKV
jgi:hypothetical protein